MEIFQKRSLWQLKLIIIGIPQEIWFGFDKELNRSFNHRPIVSSTLAFKDRILNYVRRTGQPSVGSF